jgi:thiol-disulfide isomerase/thioredoxin
MAAVVPQYQVHITTEEDLVGRLATGGCKVVEVYSEWCGPCKSILPTCKKLRLEGKDEEALSFLLIAAEACKQQEQLKEHQGKSEPLFLVYRVR